MLSLIASSLWPFLLLEQVYPLWPTLTRYPWVQQYPFGSIVQSCLTFRAVKVLTGVIVVVLHYCCSVVICFMRSLLASTNFAFALTSCVIVDLSVVAVMARFWKASIKSSDSSAGSLVARLAECYPAYLADFLWISLRSWYSSAKYCLKSGHVFSCAVFFLHSLHASIYKPQEAFPY